MKLRYFIPLILAILTMVSCSEDYEPSYLGNVKVSQSYVALPANGGTVEVTVNANESWSITDIPEWLTISPAQGSAGETKVAFTAQTTTESKEAYVYLTCGKNMQRIDIVQMTEKVELPISTCAEIIAGEDSKTYRAKGAVTKIANTVYGNYYLQDETGEIYVYGTLDKNGNNGKNNSIDVWGIEVGDILTVEGPKTTYNGTVELVDVAVIAIEKSLIKVDSLDLEDNTVALEGGDFKAVLVNKGNGVSVNIPDNAKSWLHLTGIDISGTTTIVSFHADANTGGDRNADIVFNTTDGTKTYSAEATIFQKGSIIAATVAEFVAAEVGDTQYRITGVVSELYASDKQEQSFYIQDYSGTTLVYRAAGFKESGAKVGDVVTVVGKRAAYKDTPQMGSGTFEEIKYAVTQVSIAEFLTKDDASDVYYMVTGTIDEIANDTYGNLYITDGENRLYTYGCYPGWGATGDNRKGCLASKGIELGDKLTIIGPKSTYKDVPQVNGGFYFSHEKAQ